jgi:acetyl/propionyl-CoA carboxylase alpha subunit
VSALRRFPVLGTRTNIPFLIRLLDLPAFRSGHVHTGTIDEHLAELTRPDEVPPEALVALRCDRRRAPLTRIGSTAPTATRGRHSGAGDDDNMPSHPHVPADSRPRSAASVEVLDDGVRLRFESGPQLWRSP